MTKEQCSLQPNYYGSSCDFQDLQSAVQQLTTKSDAQFEELKNEKWFHRIFNMVICPRKNNIRMAEQITSLAQAQGILIEILVRLADQDANIAGMVMQSQSDIRALAQNSAYLQERLYLLEDKSYGIKENENLKDLNSQQRNILSGCLNEASKLYVMPSNEQRLYANELLNYLNADAQVANLEDALDDLEDNAKRKILSCVITYMYLYDHTAESMEQDEQEDFIDLFDLGRKTIKSLKQQTVDTYRLRGVDGCIDRYITAPIEITEETPFEVELPEPKAAEGASEAQTEENGEEAIDTNAPREKLVLSGSIQNDGETIYKDTRINNVINFYSWCASRLIPRDRTYAKEILNSIGASQSVTDRERAQIALSYHCLSLLDVFWVKEENETVRFEDIDLYTHSLSNALVDIALRGHQMAVTNAHLLANDLSTGGCYPKAWVRKEEGFYLYKAGGQDAVEREVLASKICRCFDCHQVLYEQGMFENEPLSISKIMTSQRYSLVTYAAYDVYCTNHDWNTLDKILELDAHGYYMMNILDYLVGNTDRHWGNWGLLVDNETNRPIRLHDLMDFNRAFQQYDTLDGANCLTVGKRHLSQKEAAMEAVRKIGLNQFVDVAVDIFPEYENWLIKFQVRLHALKANESFR